MFSRARSAWYLVGWLVLFGLFLTTLLREVKGKLAELLVDLCPCGGACKCIEVRMSACSVIWSNEATQHRFFRLTSFRLVCSVSFFFLFYIFLPLSPLVICSVFQGTPSHCLAILVKHINQSYGQMIYDSFFFFVSTWSWNFFATVLWFQVVQGTVGSHFGGSATKSSASFVIGMALTLHAPSLGVVSLLSAHRKSTACSKQHWLGKTEAQFERCGSACAGTMASGRGQGKTTKVFLSLWSLRTGRVASRRKGNVLCTRTAMTRKVWDRGAPSRAVR